MGEWDNNNVSKNEITDKGGFLWGLLGFCIPIIGLILFFIWKDSKPRTSKVAGIGALVSVIVAVVFYVLLFILSIGFVVWR